VSVSLSYLACKAHGQDCHLWRVQLYNIFPHYLINGMNSRKKLLNKECVSIFSINLPEIFLIPTRIQLDIIINVQMFSCKVPDISVMF